MNSIDYNFLSIFNFELLKKTGFTITHNEDWIFCLQEDNFIPNQGWKIHITSDPFDFIDTVKVILPVLLQNHISFKIPSSWHKMLSLTSGASPLINNGKLITLYPSSQDNQSLENISYELSNVLSNKIFPQVFTDIQYKNTNIFFRYGAFKKFFIFGDRDEKIYALFDSQNKLVADNRLLHESAPSFIETPSFLVKNKKSQQLISIAGLDLTEAVVIRRTAKGNVYKVKYNGRNAILKEGYHSALTEHELSGSDERIINEWNVLNKVRLFNAFPIPLHFFKTERSAFIIESQISGTTLEDFFKERIYFKQSYNTINIAKQLLDVVNIIHSVNIVVRDLTPANVIVDEGKVYLIDFEISSEIHSSNPFPGLTPGFTPAFKPLSILRNTQQFDFYSFGAILFFLTTSVKPVFHEGKHSNEKKLYFKKLYQILSAVQKNSRLYKLGSLGIDLMMNSDRSYSNIAHDIVKIGSYKSRLIPEKMTYNVKHIASQFILYHIQYLTRQGEEWSQFKSNDSSVNADFISIDNGIIALLLLIEKFTSIYDDKRFMTFYEEAILKIENIVRNRPNINNRISVMNGMVTLLTRISWFRQETNKSETYMEDFQLFILDNILDKLKLVNYNGFLYGLSGIGSSIIMSLKSENNNRLKEKKILVVKSVSDMLSSRKKHTNENSWTWDIKNINSKSTLDFGYGLAGIGNFFLDYYNEFRDDKVVTYIESIFIKLRQEMIHNQGNKHVEFHLYEGVKNNYPFLFSGTAGIGLFFNKFAKIIGNNDADTIVKDIVVSLANERNITGPSVQIGAAGILVFLSSLETRHDEVIEKYRDIIMAQSSKNSDYVYWTVFGQYEIHYNSFLKGNFGILYSLIDSDKFQ